MRVDDVRKHIPGTVGQHLVFESLNTVQNFQECDVPVPFPGVGIDGGIRSAGQDFIVARVGEPPGIAHVYETFLLLVTNQHTL